MQSLTAIAAMAAHMERARQLAPAIVDDIDVWHHAARFLVASESSPAAGADGHAAYVQGVIGDMAGLARHAHLAGVECGDVDQVRADHAWIDAWADAREEDRHAVSRVPDYYTSVRHTVVAKRSNSGRTARKVTRRGKAWIVGSREPDWDAERSTEVVPWVASAMLGRCGRSAGGTVNGLDVLRATDAAYGGAIPALIGTDAEAWSEVLPTHVSDILASGPYSYARHTVGAVTRRNERSGSRARKPRLRLSRVRRRDSDPTPRVHDGGWFRIAEATAPTGDDDTMFVGHRRVGRGQLAHVTGKRRARNITDERFMLPDHDTFGRAIGNVASILGRGDRAEWTTADRSLTGTITLSGAGYYHVAINGGGKTRGRTPRGLARTLDNAR